MKSNHCGCTTVTATACRSTAGERPRYFPRQLVTAEDLMMEQEYFRNRMRLHNRLMHGWGVVCGLQVAPVARKDGSGGLEPWLVKVCHGDALGPYGDEIMVPCDVEIDLRQDSISGSSVEDCATVGDVWCSDAWHNREQEHRLYLAIKYAEIPARPVRVQPAGCGCDDNACEYSRLRDGYVIKVLTAEEYRPLASDLSRLPDWPNLFRRRLVSPPNEGDPNPECCPCPERPWVALAAVTIDAEGRINAIDNCSPRRLVAALGCFYWSCASVELASVSTLSPPLTFECGMPGQGTIELRADSINTIILAGEGFQPGLRVDMGAGISTRVDEAGFSPTLFSVEAQVQSAAAAGLRDVVVINPDCSTAFCLGALTVPAAETTRFDRPQPPIRPQAARSVVEGREPSATKPKRRRSREG